MVKQFARAAILAKDGVPVAGSALLRAGMAALSIAWVASLSPQDAGNFGLAMAIFASLSSLSMGLTVLAQVRFAGTKEKGLFSSDEGPDLVWAALLCGLFTTVLVCLAAIGARTVVGETTRWPAVIDLLFHLATSYPAIYGSSVLAMNLIATGKKSWILYASVVVGGSLLAIVGIAKLLEFRVTATAIADTTVALSYLTLAIYAAVYGMRLLKPRFTKALMALRGTKEFVLWPSLEQFAMLGIMAAWQSAVAESAPDAFNAIAVAMGIFGLYRALVRGVSQLGSMRMREQLNTSNLPAARRCVRDVAGAAVLSCMPLLLLGIWAQESLRTLLNWRGDVSLFGVVMTTLALSMAVDAVASVFANVLQVLRKGRFVFFCDVGLSAGIALGLTLLLGLLGTGGSLVGLFALALYQCVACGLYVCVVAALLKANQTASLAPTVRKA